jgi:long-chain acyl-CoA synthetase
MAFSLSSGAAYRILRDLIGAHLGARRNRSRPEMDLSPEARLTEPPASVDSLEAMELAGAVNEMFELHRTGLEDHLLRYRTLDRWTDVVVRSRAAHPEAIVFRTSGSTGAPRSIRHPSKTLAREVRDLAGIFSDRRRVVVFPPVHHIYGFLAGVLLPDALGVEVLEGWRMGIGSLAAALRPGDLVAGFPAIWEYLAASLPAWPAGVAGVSSTGPLRPETAERLRRAGLAGMVEIYGSTETAGIGWRAAPDDPFRLFDDWRRAGEGALVRQRSDGTREEPVCVPDRLDWISDRTFRPAGRRDGAVQVGGVNVWPERVAAALRIHPGIRDCAVRPFETEAGTRLKALVVPDRSIDSERLRNDLEIWVREHLSAPERPVRLDFGKRLPRNAMGKATDW